MTWGCLPVGESFYIEKVVHTKGFQMDGMEVSAGEGAKAGVELEEGVASQRPSFSLSKQSSSSLLAASWGQRKKEDGKVSNVLLILHLRT